MPNSYVDLESDRIIHHLEITLGTKYIFLQTSCDDAITHETMQKKISFSSLRERVMITWKAIYLVSFSFDCEDITNTEDRFLLRSQTPRRDSQTSRC